MKYCTLLFCLLFYASSSFSQNPQLWGVTSSGGAHDFGTIFKMNPDGSNQTVVHSFDYVQGAHPSGSLCLAGNGKLFGTCVLGGDFASCTIYSIDPVNYAFTTLYHMGGFVDDADYPQCGFVEFNNKLYATAPMGGMTLLGCIYSYDYNTDTYKTEYSMQGIEGEMPYSKLTIAGNKLYGVCTGGGLNHKGTIFSYDPSASTYTKVYDFTNESPYGALLYASDGMLYGMGKAGGLYNYGTIYRFDPNNNFFETLYDFDSISGSTPFGALIQDSDGKLYGMTSEGGMWNKGVIFQFDLINSSNHVLYNFDGPSGSHPAGDLSEVNGKLYGTTEAGGANDLGTIFSYNQGNSTFVKLLDFDSSNGSIPTYGSLTSVGLQNGFSEESEKQDDAFAMYPNPTKGVITVSATEPVTVYDCHGKLVKTTTATKHGQINLSAYPDGVYILKSGNHIKEILLIK